MENIILMIKEFIKEIGLKIKWKEKEFLFGLMEENMKEHSKKEKKMVMEHFILLKVIYIEETGKKISRTEKVKYIM